jgi:solute carrier family 25 oxoglutarate transporter 11
MAAAADPHATAIAVQPFVVGGCSAMLASSCVHPIDLAKVRLQLFSTINPNQKKPGFGKILATMIKDEGFKSIYSGLSASLLRQAIYGTARIGLHRKFSDELVRRNDGKPVSFGLKVGSGLASGSLAVLVGTPFDVCLVRMQGDSMKPMSERRGYNNVFDALYKIFRDEGPLKLYSGLLPNLLRGMSINVGMLACYDQAKELVAVHVMDEDPTGAPSLKTQMLASVISGFTASVFSLPFDLMKSRLQDGNKYSGIPDVFMKTLRNEGPLAFWTGLDAYYMRTAPHAMIVLMSAEPMIKIFKSVTGQTKSK